MAKRAEYLGPERRRPLVLHAAKAIFAEGGFADASMAAIAARAGVSKAVLYDCFPGGKQEIYYELLEVLEQGFMQHMVEVVEQVTDLPLEQALREGLTTFLEYARLDPDGFRIVFGGAGTADAEIARRAERTKSTIVAKMGERTRQVLDAAGVPFLPIAQIYNRAIVAVAEDLARWTLADPELSPPELVQAIVDWMMRGFEQVLPGTAWREPAS